MHVLHKQNILRKHNLNICRGWVCECMCNYIAIKMFQEHIHIASWKRGKLLLNHSSCVGVCENNSDPCLKRPGTEAQDTDIKENSQLPAPSNPI